MSAATDVITEPVNAVVSAVKDTASGNIGGALTQTKNAIVDTGGKSEYDAVSGSIPGVIANPVGSVVQGAAAVATDGASLGITDAGVLGAVGAAASPSSIQAGNGAGAPVLPIAPHPVASSTPVLAPASSISPALIIGGIAAVYLLRGK